MKNIFSIMEVDKMEFVFLFYLYTYMFDAFFYLHLALLSLTPYQTCKPFLGHDLPVEPLKEERNEGLYLSLFCKYLQKDRFNEHGI